MQTNAAAFRILTSAARLGNYGKTNGFRPAVGRHGSYNRRMAKLTLVYGLRLLPSDDIEEVGGATVKLKNGRVAAVSLHIVEGSKEEIEKQLRTSIDAFFDLYPEI